MKILAVDPGTHTGWAFVDTEVSIRGGSFEAGERLVRSDDPDGDYAMALEIYELGVHLAVERWVIEDFILLPASVRGGMNSARTGLSSVRVGASLYALLRSCGWEDGDVFWQVPSVMKVITSDRLRRAGMWVTGSEHARDAAKHLLVHLRKEVRRWED